jgi:hypothetical protein
VETGPRADGEVAPGIAAKVVRDLSAVFSFAMRREVATWNPW